MLNLYVRLAPVLLTLIELFLVLAAGFLIAWSHWKTRNSAATKPIPLFGGSFAALARRRQTCVFGVGVAVIAMRAALIPILGVPEPRFHDEFSLLLAADTFAHGRLTNPTHPMWIHFETFHVIQQPTYMSMYPPGQGLVLALGQLLGHPWVGQLLATGAMCSGICWMLQGWMPPSWALMGAVLAALRLGVLSYWMNSYFPGPLTALGGAMVLGALPRVMKHARIRDALLMGAGLAILANTRPYEGFVFSLPVAAVLMVWMVRQKRISQKVVFGQVVLPLALLLAATGLAMGYYFWRVTGNPLVMPYQVNRQTYAVAPYFIWQHLRPEPAYRYSVMRDFYLGFEQRDFESGDSFWGLVQRLLFKFRVLWVFYIGPIFTVALIGLPCAFRDRRMRIPMLVGAAVVIGIVLEVWTGAHYIAAATSLLFLFIVQSMRHMAQWEIGGRPVGTALVKAIPVLCVAMVVLRICAVVTGTHIEPLWPRGNLQRAAIAKKLQAMPGEQLVIVRYAPDHGPHNEWVYNRADIDRSKVVWARDLGTAGNQELLQYFRNRHAWQICPDDPNPELADYRAGQ